MERFLQALISKELDMLDATQFISADLSVGLESDDCHSYTHTRSTLPPLPVRVPRMIVECYYASGPTAIAHRVGSRSSMQDTCQNIHRQPFLVTVLQNIACIM